LRSKWDRLSLEKARKKLETADVKVLGITDHGFLQSIYFFDPNGIRLELTVDMSEKTVSKSDLEEARARLDAWGVEKVKALALSGATSTRQA